MKTFFSSLVCATLSVLCLSNFFCYLEHLYKPEWQDNLKVEPVKDIEDEQPINDVSLVDHGSFPSQLQPLGWKRSFFVDFLMTGQTYNNFILLCASAPIGVRTLFYENLTEAGKQGQILKVWSPVAKKTQNFLQVRDRLYHLPTGFFQNLLKNWCLSASTGNKLLNIFRLSNTKNNIFVSPNGAETRWYELQKYLRKNGLILKLPVAFLDNHWRIIIQGVRITPQINNTRALRYYYFDYYLDPDGEVVKNIPLIIIKIKDRTKPLLKDNLKAARKGIEEFMGCPEQIFSHLVKINKQDYLKNIYHFDQTIKINFLKWGMLSQVYTSQNIEIKGDI